MRNEFDRGREARVGCRGNRLVPDFCAGGIVAEKVVAVPIPRRADGTGNKSAAAVRADISDDGFDTRRAERAFIRADARFKRIGRQRLVAMFAGGSEFEHGSFSGAVFRRKESHAFGTRFRKQYTDRRTFRSCPTRRRRGIVRAGCLAALLGEFS